MRSVKIDISGTSWKHRRVIRRAARCALKHEGIRAKCQIAVNVIDEAEMIALNSRTRNIDKTTDVLSFPDGENGYLGDIAICMPVVERQAEEFGHGLRRELSYMVVHSVLHLLGYDHVDEGEQKEAMRERERAILKTMGYDDD